MAMLSYLYNKYNVSQGVGCDESTSIVVIDGIA